MTSLLPDKLAPPSRPFDLIRKRSRQKFLLGLLGLVGSGIGCDAVGKTWNPRDFGAQGDGTTLETAAIQAAIDQCTAAGGGTVRLDRGSFVAGTILLKDNVTLEITAGTQLLGSEDPRDYQVVAPFVDATGQTRGKCLIAASRAKNVALIGRGTIDGRGHNFTPEALREHGKAWGLTPAQIKDLGADRPFLLRFANSSQITLRDLRLRQPAAWTCHFFESDGILVEGIDIYSHANRNNDGIDLDSSHDAIIRNCTIDSGDDAICFKTTSPTPCHDIRVSDCQLKSDWGAIKFGTESMGDFRDITVENCRVHETRGGGIKILSVDGANIRHVTINNISMDRVDMPVFIRLGERLRTYRTAAPQTVGSIDDVTISNVNATAWPLDQARVTPPSGIFITGTPAHPIGKVSLNNIQVRLPGGGTAAQATATVEEQEKKYPEFSFFGVLPTSGLFARHVKHLEIAKLTINLDAADQRPAARMDDVQACSWTAVRVNGRPLANPLIGPDQ